MNITRPLFVALSIIFISISSLAQSSQTGSEALRQFFVGKSVTAKVDMPASFRGINVDPNRSTVSKEKETRMRLDRYGTAIKAGNVVQVTSVEIVNGKLSFQLAGGGAPDFDVHQQFGDEFSKIQPTTFETRARQVVNNNPTSSIAETLRPAVKYEAHKREMEEAQNGADSRTRLQRAFLADRAARVKKGSRITIKTSKSIDLITPDELMMQLNSFLDFSMIK